MEKSNLLNRLETTLTPLSEKISANIFLSAISDGFMLILPIILVGALFSLLSGVDIGAYQDWISRVGLKDALVLVPRFTSDLLSVYIAFGITYSLTKKMGYPQDAAMTGTLAIMAFLILTPLGSDANGNLAIPFTWIGGSGVITAMLSAFLTAKINDFIQKRGWVIRMPESVPEIIGRSFSVLIPAFLIAVVFLLVRALMGWLGLGSMHEFIASIITGPLKGLQTSIWSMLALVLLTNIMFAMGIHGFGILLPFFLALFMPNSIENMNAFAVGAPLPHVLTLALWRYVLLGGSGMTIGLVLMMPFLAKSNRYKQLGKLALLPGLFNINEPIIFGFPVVLNPIMAVPFILLPVVGLLLPYFLIELDILPRLMGAFLPIGTPIVFNGFLQGGLRVAISEVLIILISFAGYYPFFRIADKRALQAEQALVPSTTEKTSPVA